VVDMIEEAQQLLKNIESVVGKKREGTVNQTV
jgi:hypothetical protein